MNPNPPIKGHELIGEGNIRRQWTRLAADHDGWSGGCRCGARPDDFPHVSIYAMKRWHREHKAQLRAKS